MAIFNNFRNHHGVLDYKRLDGKVEVRLLDSWVIKGKRSDATAGIKVYLNFELLLKTDSKKEALKLAKKLIDECDEQWVTQEAEEIFQLLT